MPGTARRLRRHRLGFTVGGLRYRVRRALAKRALDLLAGTPVPVIPHRAFITAFDAILDFLEDPAVRRIRALAWDEATQVPSDSSPDEFSEDSMEVEVDYF